MATAIHPRLVRLTLWTGATPADQDNYHEVSGIADNDNAISLTDVESYSNFTTSLSGSLHGMVRGRQGSELTVEITGNSPTLAWVSDRAADLRNMDVDTEVRIHGVLEYRRSGIVANLRNGFLTTFRPVPNLGNAGLSSVPFTIRFEEVAGDLALFRPDTSEDEA